MSDPVADFLAHEQDVLAGIEGAPVGFEGGDDDAVPPAPVGEEGKKIFIFGCIFTVIVSFISIRSVHTNMC